MTEMNTVPVTDFATLGVRVGTLETDVHEVNDRLLGLDTKIDKAVTSLAHEFRTSLAALTSQISERNRTPWMTVLGGMGVALSVMTAIGQLSLSPIQSDIQRLKLDVVPRAEHIIEREDTLKRLNDQQDWLRRIDADQRAEKQRRIERLEQENYDLRKTQAAKQ
jgi:hypothetical protein